MGGPKARGSGGGATHMRSIEDVVLDLTETEGTPPELLDELFYCALVRGLASGVASWGKLFADLRGLSRGGDSGPVEVERITDEEADALIRSVVGLG